MSPADEARGLVEQLGVRSHGALESRSPIDGSVIGSVSQSTRPGDRLGDGAPPTRARLWPA